MQSICQWFLQVSKSPDKALAGLVLSGIVAGICIWALFYLHIEDKEDENGQNK